MAPSLSGLVVDRFLRLSANTANKESDNPWREACRSAGRHAAESFMKSGHAPAGIRRAPAGYAARHFVSILRSDTQ
jgi:hypothetical protein